MKSLVYIFACVLSITVFASPSFVTPNMMRRNGLTDEQYEQLWAVGKHPQIEPAAARQWIFLAHRGANITNWLETIGRTNNYAALSYRLAVTNQVHLDRLNALSLTNSTLHTRLQSILTDYHTLSNDHATVSARYQSLRDWAQKKKDAAKLSTTKAIWQAIIDHLDGKE